MIEIVIMGLSLLWLIVLAWKHINAMEKIDDLERQASRQDAVIKKLTRDLEVMAGINQKASDYRADKKAGMTVEGDGD